MKRSITCLLLCSLLAFPSLALFAPRAQGMGGAFTAIADDAYASYWNPAGLAINPGIEIAGSYQLNNRNTQIGDNFLGLKACFEMELDPFAWALGVGAASMFAYEGAKYLGDQGVVKKGWGRTGDQYSKEESMAPGVKEKDEEQKAQGQEPVQNDVSKKEFAKEATKQMGKATIHVGKEFADKAIKEVAHQTRYYFYAPLWYQPNYFRPNYWDDRYDYKEVELTPHNKAQFAGGLSVMTDQNSALDQDSNWYTFSLASGWGEIVALGANLNIYDLKVPSTGTNGLGAGFDIGALARLGDKLMLGVVAKEVLTTDIKWSNGYTSRYAMNVNLGLGLKPIPQLLIAADLQNIFEQGGEKAITHLGCEFKPIYGLALRAGLNNNNKTAGLSIGVEQLIFDYAIVGGSYNRTQTFGLNWKF